MRAWVAKGLRALGIVVLFTVSALCLAITIVPRFLDRIYYRGGQSGHFDGARFFNPGPDEPLAPPGGGGRGGFIMRWLTGSDERPPWPSRVTVAPSKPAARVEGAAMVATWIGHATVLVQTQGLNILTDPIWSQTAGPLGVGPGRVAAPGVRFEDLPKIDLLVVSHNHYDHMDLATLKRLWDRDRPLIVTSLGNDSVIGQAGVRARGIDWGQRLTVKPGVEVAVTRNHHWGSRWFTDRNRALWSSFVVRLPGGNIFFAGDTGFGDGEWPREAARLGPVRLAIIPVGAFRFEAGQMASSTHIGPREAVKVFDRLRATTALPVHWGTFRLSYEAYWTPPRMTAAIMRCSGHDPGWFAARAIGRPFVVPPLATRGPAASDAVVDRCGESDAVKALR